MRSHLITVTTSLLCFALLVACGSGDEPQVLETSDAAVLVAAPADSGFDAGVTGEVTIVDGCLGIGDNVAVWPFGTRVTDSDGPVIDVPDLGTITVGDRVAGAGGFLGAGEGALNDGRTPTVPDSCTEAGLVTFRAE